MDLEVYVVTQVKNLFQKYDVFGCLTIGGISSLLNLAMFGLCIEIGLTSYLAVAIGNFISTAFYFLSLKKLFSGPGSLSSIVRFLFTVVFNYFLSIALLDELSLFIDNLLLSRTIAIALASPVNYYTQKYFVFRN